MNHARLMHVIEGAGKFRGPPAGPVGRQRTVAAHQLVERWTRHVFHHQKRQSAIVAGLVGVGQVRMLQSLRDLNFSLESSPQSLLLTPRGGEDFERTIAMVCAIPRQVNGAHAAATQQVAYFVVVEDQPADVSLQKLSSLERCERM